MGYGKDFPNKHPIEKSAARKKKNVSLVIRLFSQTMIQMYKFQI